MFIQEHWGSPKLTVSVSVWHWLRWAWTEDAGLFLLDPLDRSAPVTGNRKGNFLCVLDFILRALWTLTEGMMQLVWCFRLLCQVSVSQIICPFFNLVFIKQLCEDYKYCRYLWFLSFGKVLKSDFDCGYFLIDLLFFFQTYWPRFRCAE